MSSVVIFTVAVDRISRQGILFCFAALNNHNVAL